MKSRYCVRFMWVCLLAVCGCETSSAEKENSTSNEKTEVVVIATQHFLTDMPEGYTPGHLRALLNKIAPDVLAVEAPTNVADPWSNAPNELWSVTKPWAMQNGIDIEPSGWLETQYQMQLGRMFQQYQADGNEQLYQQLEQRFQTKIAMQTMSCEFMNSAAHHQIWRDYHVSLHELSGEDTPWETWNARILTNVREVCQRHIGKRVAVVFGGAHAYYFLDQLSKDPGVKLVNAEQFFPLTDQEVAADTQQVDYVKAMRPLNLGAVTAPQLNRAILLLEKVKEIPEFAGDYLLFHGKCLLHQRRPKEALLEFQKLSTHPTASVSKMDGRSRLSEVARVYSGLAYLQLGDSAAARLELVDVVNDDQVTPSTRQWANQVMANISK